MYIKDGIAYAEKKEPEIKVCGVRPLSNYRLWVRFNTGEAKIFDFTPLLSLPAFSALQNETVFKQVYIDYGITVWCDGDIDISPEKLYSEGVNAQGAVSA